MLFTFLTFDQPKVSIGYTCTGFNMAGKWVGKKSSASLPVPVTTIPNVPKSLPIPIPNALPVPQNPPPIAQNPPATPQTEAEAARPSLILCQVLMGANVREVFQKKDGERRCWAIVVPNVDQILPRFVLHLKAKK